jgi:dolichol kinase
LSLAAGMIIPFDFIRLRSTTLNDKVIKLFKIIMRIDEVKTLSALSYLILGAILVVVLFPKPVAILSMLLLAFGDPASSIFGVSFGKDRLWGRKSLQGTLACFSICTAVSAIYFWQNNLMMERIVLVSVMGGLIGALSELLQIRRLDDNLTFPVFSGLGLWVLFSVFGAFG